MENIDDRFNTLEIKLIAIEKYATITGVDLGRYADATDADLKRIGKRISAVWTWFALMLLCVVLLAASALQDHVRIKNAREDIQHVEDLQSRYAEQIHNAQQETEQLRVAVRNMQKRIGASE